MARDIGDKLGPRLVDLWARAALAARRDHVPLDAKVHQLAMQQTIDRAGREVGDHLAGIIGLAFDANPGMHPEVRRYLERTASGRHQWQALAGALSVTGAGSAITAALSNELAPVTYALIESNPHLIPDIGTVAGLVARGLRDFGQGGLDAAKLGYSGGWWQALVEASETIPDAPTLFEAVNRGLLPESIIDYSLTRAGIPATYAAAIRGLRLQILSPPDAALAIVKGVISQAEGARIAEQNGVPAADFATILANTREPPGPEQLGEAVRRGFIDQARFAHGIRQSRVSDEWIDVLEALRFEPMSTADAVDAVVQGHLSEPDGKAKAIQNGLEAGDWTPLLETAGEPLSRTEMEQLYNRGKVSEAAVKQALRESRIKNKYIDDAFLLHERLPEGRQIVSAITHGALSKAEALALLADLGYSPKVAAILVAEGTNARVGAHKELTIGEIRSLFVAGVFTAAHVTSLLGQLGFDAADSAALIKGWDLLTAAAITRQAIGAVRSRYVSRHITVTQAKADLEQLNVTGAARDRYLQIWDIELSAAVAVLTEAQIVKAHKDGLISGADAYGRLLRKGYNDGDAHILLGVQPGTAVPA